MTSHALMLKPAVLETELLSTSTDVFIKKFEDVTGALVTTMTPFGDIGYATLSAGSARQEVFSFTGITVLGSGVLQLTGVTRGLAPTSPFASSPTYKFSHPANAPVIFSDAPSFMAQYAVLDADQTFTGATVFTQPVLVGTPTLPGHAATRLFAEELANAGAADSSETQKGLVEIATEAQINDGTSVGETGALLALNPAQLAASKYGLQLPSAEQKAGLGTSYSLSEDNLVIDEGSVSNGATYTASTIAFADSNPDTITDSANGFVTAGFRRGQQITITGSASNNATFRIASVSAGVLTLIATDTLVVESAGASITITAVRANKLAQFDDDGGLPLELSQTLTAFEHLVASDLVKMINDGGSAKAQKLLGKYPVYTGTDTANTESAAIGANPHVGSVRAVELSDTQVLVGYTETTGGNPIARILTIATGGTITVETAYTVASVNSGDSLSLAKLTATTFVVGYADAGVVYYKVGTVSGTAISYGAASSTTGSGVVDATEISSTAFAVAHKTSGGAVNAQIGTVSGTTITFGAATQVDATGVGTSSRDIAIAMLTTTLMVVTWREGGTAYCAAAAVSGATIGTFGTPVSVSVFNTNAPMDIERLSDSSFIFAYVNGSQRLEARVSTVSGTTITQQTAQVVSTSTTPTYISINVINKNCFVVSGVLGNYFVVNIQNDGITFNSSSAKSFDASVVGGVCIEFITTSRAIFVWDDVSNQAFAKTIDFGTTDDRGQFDGIVETTIAEGASGSVCTIRGALAVGQTVTPGSLYYIQPDGTLDTTPTEYRVGIALTSSTLLKLL